MSLHTLRRPAGGLLLLAVVLATGLTARGQSRYQLIARDTIAEVTGLEILTIRDSQLALCYTLFVLAADEDVSSGQPSETVPEPTIEERAEAEVRNRFRAALERRDRQLAELQRRIDPSSERDRWRAGEYEAARREIETDFENELMGLVPDTRPWARLTPGMPSGGAGWEDEVAALLRQEDEAPQTAATSDPGEDDAALNRLLGNLAQRGGTTVTGPRPCDPSGAASGNPPL